MLGQARRAGFRELADLAALGIEYQTTSVATTAQLLRERPAVAAARMRALAEAIHVIKTDRAASLATFRALIQEDDEQVLDETYERYALKFTFEELDLQDHSVSPEDTPYRAFAA